MHNCPICEEQCECPEGTNACDDMGPHYDQYPIGCTCCEELNADDPDLEDLGLEQRLNVLLRDMVPPFINKIKARP